jgi:hypothetical protein
MHGIDDDLRSGHRGRIQRRPSPGDVHRQTSKIDQASIPTVTTQIMGRAHENAIDRARLDAQRAEHAFRVVDRETRDLESLAAARHAFLANVDAIDRTDLGALIAGNARRQIIAMKTPITGCDRHGQLGIFEVLGERSALGTVRDDPISHGHPHAVGDGVDRVPDVAQPSTHVSSRTRGVD